MIFIHITMLYVDVRQLHETLKSTHSVNRALQLSQNIKTFTTKLRSTHLKFIVKKNISHIVDVLLTHVDWIGLTISDQDILGWPENETHVGVFGPTQSRCQDAKTGSKKFERTKTKCSA